MNTTLTQQSDLGCQHDMGENKRHPHFDETHILHELKHYLPSQQALKKSGSSCTLPVTHVLFFCKKVFRTNS